MLQAYNYARQKRIVNNIYKATIDINDLKPIGYKYISLASGFIAHTSIKGFKCYYARPENNLAKDILKHSMVNTQNYWLFTDKNYHYHNINIKIYKWLVENINQYKLYLTSLTKG